MSLFLLVMDGCWHVQFLLQAFLILLMLRCRLVAEDGGAKQVHGGFDQDTCFHARPDSGAIQMFASVWHSICVRMSMLMF